MQRFSKTAYQAGKRSDCSLIADLKVCSSTRNLERGKEIHAEAIQSGYDSWIYVATTLINMYAKCGDMANAHRVFDCIKHPNAVSWNTLMLGYSDNGEALTALDLFARMKSQGCVPTSITYVAALKACTSLAITEDVSRKRECLVQGKQIHLEIGSSLNIYVQNTLLDMYAKYGHMVEARHVFDSIKQPDVVSWNALILGYADNGEGATALDLFAEMRYQGCVLNRITFVAALKACSSLALEKDGSRKAECLERGKKIHSEIGGHLNICVQSTLIDMYAKCGSMVEAHLVFDCINNPDVVSWNALILGYSENGDGKTALKLFERMKSQGCAPDRVSFVAALKACTSFTLTQDESGRAECLLRGKQIHADIGCSQDSYVQNSLTDMYSKSGSMVDARRVFEDIKHPNVVSWSALILGHAENGEGVKALELFSRMKSQGCAPNSVTYLAVFKACGLLGALESGRKIHSEMDAGVELNVMLVTCLVDFYAKCGSLVEARKLFESHPRKRDLRTWTALLAGYGRLGDNKAVFELFEVMQDAGFQPNGITFLCILTCCSHGGLLEKANEFFEAMSANYGITPAVEHYNCMIDILGRSNKLDDVMAMLQSMPCKPGAITWMAVLCACRKWKNVEIGRLAFNTLVSLDHTNSSAYVLMGQIYTSRDMWEEREMLLGMRKKIKSQMEPEQSSWANEVGEVHTFLAADRKHPQIYDIQRKLNTLPLQQCFANLLSSSTQNMTDTDASCGHTEKMAIACALVNTEPEKSIRIVKNLKVCDDCHSAIAIISELEHRTIICKDSTTFHVFQDGKCACGDFW